MLRVRTHVLFQMETRLGECRVTPGTPTRCGNGSPQRSLQGATGPTTQKRSLSSEGQGSAAGTQRLRLRARWGGGSPVRGPQETGCKVGGPGERPPLQLPSSHEVGEQPWSSKPRMGCAGVWNPGEPGHPSGAVTLHPVTVSMASSLRSPPHPRRCPCLLRAPQSPVCLTAWLLRWGVSPRPPTPPHLGCLGRAGAAAPNVTRHLHQHRHRQVTLKGPDGGTTNHPNSRSSGDCLLSHPPSTQGSGHQEAEA